MRPRVTVCKMQERITRIHDGYELNAHGRFAWLHRFMWHKLKEWGAIGPAMRDHVEVLRLPVDNDSIFDRIFESYHDRFANYCQPTEVLIGPDTLSELISCPELRGYNSPFSFNAQAGFGKTIFNLPIRVVPQMEGVVVLDDRSRA